VIVEISLKTQTAEVKRPQSPGQTRVVIRAIDENEDPVPVFLCCVEPPDTFARRFRESFVTICSVEDMAEYPVGVSSVREVDPVTQDEGILLYCAQENVVYVRGEDENNDPAWIPYVPEPAQLKPNVHGHNFPFFRRSTIDIILPCRDFVVRAIGWIEDSVAQLMKDQANLEILKEYE
jgi:hypothetical protein